MSGSVLWLFILTAAYWAFCTYWGVEGSRRCLNPKTSEAYFLAERSIAWWIFVLAATGATILGTFYVGLPGLFFRDGFPAVYVAYGAISMAIAGALFMKRQWVVSLRFGLVTPAEMLGSYYGSEAIRAFVVLIGLVFAVPFCGIQLFATGMLVEAVTAGEVGRIAAMWVLSAILFLSLALGGMRAAVFIGALQAVLALAGILMLSAHAYADIGGYGAFNDELAKIGETVLGAWGPTSQGYSSFLAVPGVMQFTAGLGAQIPAGGPWTSAMIASYLLALMGLVASPGMTAMVMSCRSPRAFAFQQLWASASATGLLVLFAVTAIGIGAHVLAFNNSLAEVDLLVARFIAGSGKDAPWFVGLLTICGIAGLHVMVGLHVSAAGSMVARDISKRYFHQDASPQDEKRYARIAIFFIMVSSLLIATYATELLVQAGALALPFGAQLVPPLIGLCWFRWVTREGALVALGAGLLVVTLTENFGVSLLHFAGLELPWGRWPWTIHSAGWGLAANCFICLVVSLASRRYSAAGARNAIHQYLRSTVALSEGKKRQRAATWGIVLVWIFLAVGPGVIIGNDIFGAPNAGRGAWVAGVPSIWAWQITWWVVGVLVVWLVAYRMELSTIPTTRIVPLAADEPNPATVNTTVRADLGWFWPAAILLTALTAVNWSFR